MARVVIMERSDGAFQKVMRTAETEIDSFGASGSGPMHEMLRAAYDSFLRGHPNLEPEQCFALAWRGLSLSDQAQLRSEESGEYQERLAEEARLRQSVTRANGREIENTMKHEQVSILLKAVRGVLADEDLTKAEREDVLRETFDDYAYRTSRDGLADILSLRAMPTSEPIVMKAQTRQDLAIELLKIKAAELRKARPNLSESQAFSRVYTDPSNAEIAQIERQASSAQFAEQAASSYTGESMEKRTLVAKRDAAYAALQVKGEELRRADPLLTREGAIAKAMNLYPDLAARERQASRAALYA
jgi:hypothetical protein